MATASVNKPGFFQRRITKGATMGAALLFFILGIIFWGGFNTAMEATNTLEFCTSCHEMEENVYQEYAPTIHHSNRSGVRAVCSDCHVPKPWIHKMIRKVQASNEVLHKILGTIDTPEKFDKKRLTLAKHVWETMKKTDSRECRNCHNLESMNPSFQKPRARKQHLNAMKTGQTCIDCHKGIAHKGVRDLLTDEELEELEKPNPAFIREVPEIYLQGLKVVEQREKEAAAREAAEQEKKLEKKKKAKIAEKKRIDAAVKAALAKAAAAAPVAAATTTAASVSTSGEAAATAESSAPATTGSTASTPSNVNWDNVPSRTITLFYPGIASMEWVLTGKDHGGARPFTKTGDTCVSCHDRETSKMGEKIITGKKEGMESEAEVVPGKRGSIPVNVQATHDADNLYMRFEWENGEHVDMPSAEGGKMDPENPMKLAIMFTTDDVEYASQAGCWVTCHHDANNMPHNPGQKVTKYLKESRTKIEVKGRRGKKRGGWDKRKSDADITAELSAGHFMDLIRYKSGKGITENGYILADRIMEGGEGAEFTASLEDDTWVVELKRQLKSTKPSDLNMEMDKLYNFGFAIHDDYANSRFHHVSLGYRLGFDNDKADINAIKQ